MANRSRNHRSSIRVNPRSETLHQIRPSPNKVIGNKIEALVMILVARVAVIFFSPPPFAPLVSLSASLQGRFARGVESPTVPSRASPKQSGGGIGGFRGRKRTSDLLRIEWGLRERPLRGDPRFAGVLLRSACDLIDHNQIAGFRNSR